MRRLIYLLIWLLLPAWLSAQINISAMEYWYDGDYSTASRQTITGSTVNYSDLLDVSSLEQGLHTFTIRFQDSRGVWGSVHTKFFTHYSDNTGPHLVTDVEYWYDGDYSTAVETSLASGTSVDWNTLLDVSSLIDGLHTVSCHFKDDRGIWSAPLTRFFKVEANTGLKQLVALEYWFDNDYAGKVSETFAATSLYNMNQQIDVSALTNGLHFFSLRLKDESGNWNAPASWYFTKYDDETPVLHQITAKEYWFDSDYSSVQIDAVTATSQLNVNTSLDVSALSDGLHIVSTRYGDEAGKWSSAYSQLFVKYPAEPAVVLQKLMAVEYWIDGDISSSTVTSVPAGSEYLLDTQLDVSTLGNGLHTLSYRFQDEAGKWSAAISALFNKFENDVVVTDNKIAGYRYWPNNDMASATEVTLATPVKSLILDELVDVANFPGGIPVASFQFVDAQGNWSSAISKTISKEVQPKVVISADDSTVCLGTPISFDADIADADVIEWKFGDGTTSLEIMPEHIYTDAGTFEVSAIVTHTDSAKSANDTIVGGITVYPSQNIWLGDVDTIFFSSFEGDNLNTAPSGWIQKYDGTGTANQIVVDNPVKYGIKAFQMEGASSWASEYYRRPVTMPTEITLEAWVNCEKILSGIAGSIGVGNFNIGSWGTRTSRLQFFDGKISATYSDGPTYEIMDYTPGQWYHVKMIHDLVNRSYQVYINNVKVSGTSGGETTSDFPMHPTVETIDVMLCAGNSGTTKMFFDDILLTKKGDFEVCETDLPYQLGGQLLTSEGFYSESFTNSYGCDSVVSLNLKINPVFEVELDSVVICQGDSYIFGTETLTMPGIHADTLQTVNGCDSILTLKLVINPTYEIPLTASICDGNSYLFNGSQLTTEGVYKDTLQTINGCDSILTLALTIDPATETPIEASICDGDSYNFAGDAISAEGIYRDTLQTVFNCDSIVVLTLTVNPVYEIPIDSTICEGESVIFGEETLTTSGIYKDTLQSALMCDSVIVLNLQVNPVYSDSTAVTICEGDSFTFCETEYSTTGNYMHTLTASTGCDSVVTLQLTVNPIVYETLNTAICQGNSYLFAGTDITNEGEYKDTLISANGCDSIVTLNLTVNPTYEIPVDASICEGDSYNFGEELLTASGIYKDTLQSVSNCDSVVVLNLSVYPVYEIPADTAICIGSTYSFGGDILSESGIYRDTLQSLNSCDSIIILTLTVNDTFNIKDTLAVCENDLPFAFGSQTLTVEGSYTEVFTSSAGCDSTVTLYFTISDTSQSAYSDTICENDLPYIFGTQSLSASGIFKEVFAATNGCDSLVTLSLTVHDSYNTPIYKTVSPSELPYVFASKNLTKTGTYTNTLTSVFGCDSVITLHLLVKDDIPPVAKCQAIEIELAEDGTYQLSKTDISEIAQGSCDDVSAFEDLTIVVTPSTFTCSNLGENTVNVQVSDAAGNKANCQTSVRVVDVVRDPEIDEVPDQIISEDSTLMLTLSGISGGTSCAEQEVSVLAEHSNQELVSSLTIDYLAYNSTAILEIVPFAEQFGTDSITVTVRDSLGNQTSIGFILTVTTENDPPEFVQFIEDRTMVAGDSSTLYLSKIPGEFFDDPDDSDLLINLSVNGNNIPDWIKINEDLEQYIITFIPTPADTGCFDIIVNIQDQAGDLASDTFNVCINPLEVGVIQLTENEFEINLYPNPSRGQVNIDLKNVPAGEIELLVTNIIGSEVFRKTYQNNQRIVFDLSEHTSGSYLVLLKINQHQIVRKLILDKK
ncbi:T9SS type A sorting domain-containing protein [Draconibacterium sp. IB214405]|uniref:T9SS type A sorting domain-containing protein n=1 Tax=Draconibacterium sp. IB214405 TaxID=3097352 RepID=UPI002A0BD21C|nr:T9SS type A sorting domain-containing protein [Draconibacterium sp. IB214405]MDX8337673.1 T9SS type A sorting domain-containing protein [Draconibacterium sp. IB214405]